MSKKSISLITLGPRNTEYDFIAPLAERLADELSRELVPGSEIVLLPE